MTMRTWSAVPLLLALGAGCAATTTQLPREQLTDPGALLFNGYARPEVGCHKCHGGDGRGAAKGPSLEKRVPKYSAAELVSIIREGSKKMPKFGPNKATDDEVQALVAWMQAAFPGPAGR
jgi:mono/diheme cytochrome c family protein